MNPLINLDHVGSKSTNVTEWRAKLPDEVNSNEQDD